MLLYDIFKLWYHAVCMETSDFPLIFIRCLFVKLWIETCSLRHIFNACAAQRFRIRRYLFFQLPLRIQKCCVAAYKNILWQWHPPSIIKFTISCKEFSFKDMGVKPQIFEVSIWYQWPSNILFLAEPETWSIHRPSSFSFLVEYNRQHLRVTTPLLVTWPRLSSSLDHASHLSSSHVNKSPRHMATPLLVTWPSHS